MSHDTHHKDDNKPGSSFTSSIWFMLLLAFLFVSAVNFVEIMGHDEGSHGTEQHDEHATSEHHGAESHGDEHGHEEGHH